MNKCSSRFYNFNTCHLIYVYVFFSIHISAATTKLLTQLATQCTFNFKCQIFPTDIQWPRTGTLDRGHCNKYIRTGAQIAHSGTMQMKWKENRVEYMHFFKVTSENLKRHVPSKVSTFQLYCLLTHDNANLHGLTISVEHQYTKCLRFTWGNCAGIYNAQVNNSPFDNNVPKFATIEHLLSN